MSDEPGASRAADDELLARAARTLRELTDDGWVRARPAVLERALRALQPARSVRGRHRLGTFAVAVPVLVTRVREHVDAVPGLRTLRVRCTVGDDDTLETITLDVAVTFGTVIAEAADAVRVAARRAVTETVGVELAADDLGVDLQVDDVEPGPGTLPRQPRRNRTTTEGK